jgi:hypothetical protein
MAHAAEAHWLEDFVTAKGGCGRRTSMRLFRAPHLAHFILDLNHGTGVSPQ